MQLHKLKSNNPKRSKKRIARGGKRGTYSGRGQKGQKSRAGHRIRPASRDLLIRIPKLRGIKNPSLRNKAFVVTLSDISKIKADVITLTSLKQAGILSKKFKGPVKLLGDGNINVPVNLKGIQVSKSAKMKIEKAGGSVINN